MLKQTVAFAPASVANVGCAFDVLGFALEQPCDEVRATLSDVPGVRITSISGEAPALPLEAEKNTAGVAALALLKHLNSSAGVDIELKKGLPVGSGLGSSSASAVAAAVAVNALLGNPLPREDLLPFTMEGERVACGSAHADNVAPCLLGGFVLIRSYSPLDVVRLGSPADLFASVVCPHIEVRTEDARRILKKHISFRDAVTQWGNIAGLITGILKPDPALLGRSLGDILVEPERAVLIPGYAKVKQAALDAGVLGCSISGSGPSVFALSTSSGTAAVAASAMQQAFRAVGIESAVYFSRINTRGATVVV